MPQPVCVKCEAGLEVTQRGVLLVVHNHNGIYQIWSADLLTCPTCQAETVSRFADQPMARQDDGQAACLALLRSTNLSRHGRVIHHFENALQREAWHQTHVD